MCSTDYDNCSTVDEYYDPGKDQSSDSEMDISLKGDNAQVPADKETERINDDYVCPTARLHKRTGNILARKRKRDKSRGRQC